MEKFNKYLSKMVYCMVLLLLPAFIHVGNAVGAPSATNVNVINTPNVNVVNPPSAPLPVIEKGPASQPFQATVGELFAFNEVGKTFTFVTVPAGKRLVIEYVTVNGFFEVGSAMVALITTTVGGITAQHQLVVTQQGVLAGSLVFAAAQPLRLYADPGTNVLGIVSRDPITAGGGAGMTISGYYVDLP